LTFYEAINFDEFTLLHKAQPGDFDGTTMGAVREQGIQGCGHLLEETLE
jgi:hypothetical protein